MLKHRVIADSVNGHGEVEHILVVSAESRFVLARVVVRTSRAVVEGASLVLLSLSVPHKWTVVIHVLRQPCNHRGLLKCCCSLLLELLALPLFHFELRLSSSLELQLFLLLVPLVPEFLRLATLLFKASHLDSLFHFETRF